MGRFGNEYLAESVGYANGHANGMADGVAVGREHGYTQGWNEATIHANGVIMSATSSSTGCTVRTSDWVQRIGD